MLTGLCTQVIILSCTALYYTNGKQLELEVDKIRAEYFDELLKKKQQINEIEM